MQTKNCGGEILTVQLYAYCIDVYCSALTQALACLTFKHNKYNAHYTRKDFILSHCFRLSWLCTSSPS